MKNNIDKTVQYDPSPELDDILNTFEKTSDSVENAEEKTAEENKEKESDGGDNKKSVDKKKLIIIIACVCAVILIIGAVMLFTAGKKNASNIVVKKADGTFALCGSDGTEKIEKSITKYKYSPDKSVMSFFDENNKLYVCLVNDNGKTELVSEKVDGEYFVTDTAVFYIKDGKLICYDTENNENEEIANGVNTLKVSENGNIRLFTKLSGDKTELYRFENSENEPISLSKNAEAYAVFGNGQSVVFAEKNENFYTVKICSASGEIKTVAADATEYRFPEDENSGNIYYFKESDTIGRTSIVFEDKMKDSDSVLKEPDADDYKKNLGILGIIQYTDSKAYKQAYLEYQDKLARDSARAFAENYVSSQSEVTFSDAYCYSNNSSVKVADGIVKQKIVSYSESGTPRILYEKVISTVSTTLEISDIAKEIKGGDSQQEFNALVDSKITSGVEDCGLYVSSSSGDFSADKVEISSDDTVSFSPDGNILLTQRKKGENIRLSSYRLSDGSVRKQLDSEVKGFDFCASSFWVLKTDGTLCCSAVSGNYADCDTRAENVTSFSVEDGGEVTAICDTDAFIIGEKNKTLIGENVTELCHVGKGNIFYISDNNLYHFDGKKSEKIEDGVSDILF